MNEQTSARVSAIDYGKPVGKRITVRPGGIEKESLPRPPEGKAIVQHVSDIEHYARLRKSLTPSHMLLAGTFEDAKHGQTVRYSGEGDLAADKKNLQFRAGGGVLLIDCDVKDPDEVAALYPKNPKRFTGGTELVEVLRDIAPWLEGVGIYVCDSSSAMIHSATGERVTGPGSLRAAVLVDDAREIPRILETLHKLAIANGCGLWFISKGGAFLERSIVDLAMARPTQPDYPHAHVEGGASRKRSNVYPGGILRAADVPALGEEDVGACARLSARAREALKPAEEATRQAVVEREVARMVAAGAEPKAAKRAARRLFEPKPGKDGQPGAVELAPEFVIEFEKLGAATVAEVCADPARFDGQDCLDPVDPDYDGGRACAKFFANKPNGEPSMTINSFAHGERKYHLPLPPAPEPEPKAPAVVDDFLGEPVAVEPWAGADELPDGVPPPPRGSVVLPTAYFTFIQSARLLFGLLEKRGGYFYRGGAVMALNPRTEELEVLRPARLQSLVDLIGPVYAHVKDQNNNVVLRLKRCPKVAAKVLLESEPASGLPHIETVSSCPVLVEHNGLPLVLGPGYHREAGGVLVRGGGADAVPLEEARDALVGLLVEFDFVTESDLSRALAALITPALRMGAMLTDPSPIDVAEADDSQAGKGYLQGCTRAIYGETPRRKAAHLIGQKKGGVGSLDESFSAGLLSGKPFITFDNVRGKLDSMLIEAVVTWGSDVPCRVPFHGEVKVSPQAVTLQLTSNGLEATRDLMNRASIIRLRKRRGHQFRRWAPGGDLRGHIVARQSYYLGCVFAVVGAWIEAGKPRTDDVRHDMRQWAQSLDWIVTELLGRAPLLDGHEGVQERAADPMRSWVRTLALKLVETGAEDWLTAEGIVEFCEGECLDIPRAREVDRANLPMVLGKRMKKVFGSEDAAFLDGVVFERRYEDRKTASRNVRSMQLYRAYDVRKPPPPAPPARERDEVPF